ncbi:hypothetical protein NEIG_00195 [Nematocida sp. ERTm5]|nr:hypothetical protein NEIG_00195 [Nematocida sp. ERTm5]
MRFIKEIYTVSLIGFGAHYVMCGLIPNATHMPYNPMDVQVPNIDIFDSQLNTSMLNNINNQSEIINSAARVTHAINSAEAAYATESPQEIIDEFILSNEKKYRNMFKVYKHDDPDVNMQEDYRKLNILLKSSMQEENPSKEEILSNIYTQTRYSNRIRSYGFSVIGPMDIELAKLITTEQAEVHTDEEHKNISPESGRYKFITSDIGRTIDLFDYKLSAINRQLDQATNTLKYPFEEKAAEYKWFSKNLAISFNMFNMINSIRVNRILSAFKIQRLMKFSNEAVDQMNYHKEVRNFGLYKNNKEMTDKERALNEFNYTLKLPDIFKTSVLNVKYKKTIISSMCMQILNFISEFKEAIKTTPIPEKIKTPILLDFHQAYVYGLKSIDGLKYVDAYSFNNDELLKVEDSFTRFINKYLEGESKLSNYIERLKEKIDARLYMSVSKEENSDPTEITLSTENQDDRETLHLISILRWFLSIEKDICYKEIENLDNIIIAISDRPQKDAYPSMRYFTYLNKVTENNDIIDQIIEKYQSKS